MDVIPTVTEVLQHRVTQALLDSKTFAVRVDLSHIPPAVRDQVRAELVTKGYVVGWNQDHQSQNQEKADRIMKSLLYVEMPDDFWLILPAPPEPKQ